MLMRSTGCMICVSFFVIGKGKCKGKASQTTDIHQKNNDKPRDKIKLSGQSGCHSGSTDCGYDFKKRISERKTLHAADCEGCGKSGKQVGTQQGCSFCDRVVFDPAAKNICSGRS